MSEQKHVCEVILEYCSFLGVKKIDKLPGLWVNKVDDTWTIKCNGHLEAIEGVPPFSWFIEYNGWPAGIMDIMGGGILCAGEGGNEANLIAALESKMKKEIINANQENENS